MLEYFLHLPDRVAFAPSRMSKIDCFRSGRMLVGLNCFEAGQTQPAHVHAGADKVYVVLSGKATFRVGDATRDAGPHDLVVAPAGVAHGVDHVAERTVVLVAIAPAEVSPSNPPTGR